MQISDVFGAHPRSVWEYLCENGQGLYVPAYQRQYSWDKSKITRLVEDICHGFTMLIDHEDSITFLGTLIAIHDTQYLTVNPLVRGDVPSRVMTIIDGQQRLTTLLLIITVLHEEIRTRLNKLKNVDEDSKQWLQEECMKVLGRLTKTFEEDKDYGDGPYRFYPRMIRAYEDSWSRKKDKAKYISPIGCYLFLYGQYGRDISNKKPFKFDSTPLPSTEIKYKFLLDGRKTIQSLVKSIAKNDPQQVELEFPDFLKIIEANKFLEILIKADFPDSVINVLKTSNESSFEELLRVVLFANFVLDRVALTIVTAKNEDYAFDMFEALNTTGEPLTAFETFKPRVIHCEGLEKYENSESHGYMELIEKYLEGFDKTDEKQDATSRLIVSFALAEKGERLSKRLSDQRRFFKDNFEKLKEESEQKDFIKYLSHCALFIQYAWPENKHQKPEIFSVEELNKDEVILCLDVLRSFKHTIIIAPLVRLYSQIRQSNNELRAQAINDFIKALKAITAFSILWRASRRGTENIDAHYRKIMESGYPDIGLEPFARKACETTKTPDVELLIERLRILLRNEGKIADKNEWVKLAARIPAYTNQKEITRFILLAAAHDSTNDPDSLGLIISGREGLLPLLTYEKWRDVNSQTVEHIAPQTMQNEWNQVFYDDPETINRLGNLTLLPLSENSSLKNGSWKRKFLFYKILSANTSDELDPLINKAKDEGVQISDSTAELLAKSKYLPMVKALAHIEQDWSIDIIDKRSIRIAELAWDRIAPWLGL